MLTALLRGVGVVLVSPGHWEVRARRVVIGDYLDGGISELNG